MPRHFIRYIYSGIFAISFFLCLKIIIPSLAESVDTLDSEITKKYQKIILQEPSNTNAHFNLGVVYSEKGMTSEAVDEYYEALRLTSNDLSTLYNRGVLYLQNGRLNKASADMEKIIEINPK